MCRVVGHNYRDTNIQNLDFTRQTTYIMHFAIVLLNDIRGRPFDSEGGGAWHFLEINILTLKMLEINNLSSSGKKINNLTLTC